MRSKWFEYSILLWMPKEESKFPSKNFLNLIKLICLKQHAWGFQNQKISNALRWLCWQPPRLGWSSPSTPQPSTRVWLALVEPWLTQQQSILTRCHENSENTFFKHISELKVWEILDPLKPLKFQQRKLRTRLHNCASSDGFVRLLHEGVLLRWSGFSHSHCIRERSSEEDIE